MGREGEGRGHSIDLVKKTILTSWGNAGGKVEGSIQG